MCLTACSHDCPGVVPGAACRVKSFYSLSAVSIGQANVHSTVSTSSILVGVFRIAVLSEVLVYCFVMLL